MKEPVATQPVWLAEMLIDRAVVLTASGATGPTDRCEPRERWGERGELVGRQVEGSGQGVGRGAMSDMISAPWEGCVGNGSYAAPAAPDIGVKAATVANV